MTTVLLTGASRGIGRALAFQVASEGADVELILLGRKSPAQEETLRLLVARGVVVRDLECDFADRDSVDCALQDLVHDGCVPDVIFHNAGMIERQMVAEMTDDVWDKHLEVNLTCPLRITRAFLPQMLKRKSGRILFVSSISAVLGSIKQSAYHASKAGMLGAMRCLAEELSDTGLMTMALLPGSVETEMLQGSGFPPRMTADDVAQTLCYYAFRGSVAHNGAAVEMFGT